MAAAQQDQQANAYAIDDIRIAYGVAASLAIYEGELVWSRFNAMAVANSIIVATLGFTVASAKPLLLISYGMPLVGIVLCGSWLMLMNRAFDYYEYLVLSTRELEDMLPSNSVRVVSRGGSFARGKPVELKYDNQVHTLRMNWLSRHTTGRAASQFAIVIFAAIYVISFLQAIY